MDLEIHELRNKKFTIEEIAEKLGITVGQVKYRLYKKNTTQFTELKPEVDTQTTRKVIQPSLEIPIPPQYYGDSDIVVIVQGPQAVYAYWEISWPLCHLIGDFLNVPFETLPKALRIYDVTDIWFDGANAHWHRDIEIDGQADNWFIYDLLPGRTYIMDLGVYTQGRFLPIMRSKPKSTPRNEPTLVFVEELTIKVDSSTDRVRPQWFENFSTYTLY